MTEAAKVICRHKDIDANHLAQTYKCRTCGEIYSGGGALDRARDLAFQDTQIQLLEQVNANLIALQTPQVKK